MSTRVNKKDMGRLMILIGQSLENNNDFFIDDILNILSKYNITSRSLNNRNEDDVHSIMNFIEGFQSTIELREFIQIIYKMNIPYRISKENMYKLSIGTLITSSLSIYKAKKLWFKRKKILDNIVLYNVDQKELLDSLQDDDLFPDGYSIYNFAKKSRIKLPLKAGKYIVIDALMYELFSRPNTMREIGRWGLKDKKRENV